MVIDGIKQEIGEDVFDQMAQTLHQSSNPHNTPPTTSTRWQPDGTYDKKPLDPKYFQKNYQKKLAPPFTCPECGRTISSKSNLSKHRQTRVCISNRRHWWNTKPSH
jgi:inhibitor of KinA sporulation pathway (predicted exonuclease)